MPPEAAPCPSMLRRLWAMCLRFFYLMRRSPPRLIDMIYWPTLNMLVWGFLNVALADGAITQKPVGIALGVLLGASILWDLVVRSQLGMMMQLMEELWSRHLGHLLVSPLRSYELLLGLLLISALRGFIGVLPAMLLAIPIFGYSLFDLGLPLLAFYFNLMLTGWWCGCLVAGLIFRYGLAAEWFAWMALFLMSPFVCAFYPVSVLPEWLQPLAWALPPTYVFEGMRQILQGQALNTGLLFTALSLNLAYLALGAYVFLRSLYATRQRGGLLQMGE